MAKKVIRLTEEELHNVVKGAVDGILEGINVDDNRNAIMTDKHERLVDTSAEGNPTVLTDFVPNVTVWSIFKRINDDWGDGNPLLYALKNEKGYTLKNPRVVFNRIEFIVNKFFETNGVSDITIAMPSSNPLNKTFAKIVSTHCNNPQFINNLFIKMSTEEVADFVYQENSAFRKYYGRFFKQRFNELKNYFRNMPYDSFQFHKVANMDMRKVIEHTIKLSDEFYGKYIDAINDKNILIIDDSLTLGQTIKEACSIISSAYTPKSITILTLFFPLYEAGGNELEKH